MDVPDMTSFLLLRIKDFVTSLHLSQIMDTLTKETVTLVDEKVALSSSGD